MLHIIVSASQASAVPVLHALGVAFEFMYVVDAYCLRECPPGYSRYFVFTPQAAHCQLFRFSAWMTLNLCSGFLDKALFVLGVEGAELGGKCEW